MPKVKKKRLKKLKRFFSFWIPNHDKGTSEHGAGAQVTPTDEPHNEVTDQYVTDQCGTWTKPVALLIDEEEESDVDTAPRKWKQLGSVHRNRHIAIVIKSQLSPNEVPRPLGDQFQAALDQSISGDTKIWDAAIQSGSLVYAETGVKAESLYNTTGVLTFMTQGVGSETPLEFLAVPSFGKLPKIYKTRSISTSNRPTGSRDTRHRIAMLDLQALREIPNRLSYAPFLSALCRRMGIAAGVTRRNDKSIQHGIQTSDNRPMTGALRCSLQRDGGCLANETLVRSAPGALLPSRGTLNGEKGGTLAILTPCALNCSRLVTLLPMQKGIRVYCSRRALNTMPTVCTKVYIIGTVSKVYTSASRQELRFHLENAWLFLQSLAKCLNRRGYIMEITSATTTIDQVCIVISLHNHGQTMYVKERICPRLGKDSPFVMMQTAKPLTMASTFNEFQLSERAVIYAGEDLVETEIHASTGPFSPSIRNRVVKITLAQLRAASSLERPISILSFMEMLPAERRFPFPAIMPSRRPISCMLRLSRGGGNDWNGRPSHALASEATKEHISTQQEEKHFGLMLMNKFLHKSLIVIPDIVKKSLITRMSLENYIFLQNVMSRFSPERLLSTRNFTICITAEHRFPLSIGIRTSQNMDKSMSMILLSRIGKEKPRASKLVVSKGIVAKSNEMNAIPEVTQLAKRYTFLGSNSMNRFNANTLNIAERIASYIVCEHTRLSRELFAKCLQALGHESIQRLLSGTTSIRLDLLDKILLVLSPERPLCIKVINATMPRERRFPMHRSNAKDLQVSGKTAIVATRTESTRLVEMKAPSRFNEKLAFWARINPIISPHVLVSSRNNIPASETGSTECTRPLNQPSIHTGEVYEDHTPDLSEFIDDVINKSIQQIDEVDGVDERLQHCDTNEALRKRSRVKYLQFKFLQWHLSNSGSMSTGHQSNGGSSNDKFWCTDRAKYFLPRPFKILSTKEPVVKEVQEEIHEICEIKDEEGTEIQNINCIKGQNAQIEHLARVVQQEETQVSEVDNHEEIEIQDATSLHEDECQAEHLSTEGFDAQFLQNAKDHRLKERPVTGFVNLWRMSRYLQFLLKNKKIDGTECPPDSRWPTQDIRWNKLNPTNLSMFSSKEGTEKDSLSSLERSSETREDTSDHIVLSEESRAAGTTKPESPPEKSNTGSASKDKIQTQPSRIPRPIGHLPRNASVNSALQEINLSIPLAHSQMGHGSRISNRRTLGNGARVDKTKPNYFGRPTKHQLSKIPVPRSMPSSPRPSFKIPATTPVGSKCFPRSFAQGMVVPTKVSCSDTLGMIAPRKGSRSVAERTIVPKKQSIRSAQGMIVPKEGSISSAQRIVVPQNGSSRSAHGIAVLKKGSSRSAQRMVVPMKVSSSSTQANIAPKKGANISAKGMVVPMKGSSRSAQGIIEPKKVVNSSAKGMVAPRKGSISLLQGMTVPTKVLSSSAQEMGVSKKGPISATQTRVAPKKGSSSSIEGTFVPKKGSHSSTQGMVVSKTEAISSHQRAAVTKKESSSLKEGTAVLKKASSSSIEEMIVSKKGSSISTQEIIVPRNGSSGSTQGTVVLKKGLDQIKRNISTKTKRTTSSLATRSQTDSSRARPLPSQERSCMSAPTAKCHNDVQCAIKQTGVKQQQEVNLECHMHISEPSLVSRCTSHPSAVQKLTNVASASSMSAHPSCESINSKESGSSSPRVAQKRPWNPAGVISYLKGLTPLKNLTLKQLTLKLVMLLNLLTENCTILHDLSLDYLSLDETKACFRSPGILDNQAELPALELRSYTVDADLCVVEVLKEYIKRTKKVRKSRRLLINYMPPHDAVGNDVISRWVKTVLSLSGVDVHVSTMRERSSSLDAQLKAIMDGCCWPDKCRFAKFYNKGLTT